MMAAILPSLMPYLLVLGVAALMGAPFLLFAVGARFTGRRMVIFALGMFGMIIAVNLLLAVKAVGTFPGLEVRNSYVASQLFDRDRAAQLALGWRVTPEYDGQIVTLAIVDAKGQPADVATMTATIGRPTQNRDDVTPHFTYRDGVYAAPVTLAPGVWNIHLVATATDGTEFRQRLDHYAGDRVN